VDEESHVLRYWEEELALKIPRDDLGHRYYTEVQLDIFRTIKDLKQKGYQLKEIKQWLEDMEKDSHLEQEEEVVTPKELDKPDPGDIIFPQGLPLPAIPPMEEMKAGSSSVLADKQINGVPEMSKLQEFRQLMSDILSDVMSAGYEKMSDDITERVSRRVIKEINYLDREREEWQEEQFKQLDETIRNCQRRGRLRAETAATGMPDKRKKWKIGLR
jgi:DNA-binding transcriptional MerR regulator